MSSLMETMETIDESSGLSEGCVLEDSMDLGAARRPAQPDASEEAHLNAVFAAQLEELAEGCWARRMTDGAEWAAEMLCCLPEAGGADAAAPASPSGVALAERLSTADARKLRLVYSLIDSQAYARAAALSEGWALGLGEGSGRTSPLRSFLHFLARYLAAEKERLDGQAEVLDKAQAQGRPGPAFAALYDDLTAAGAQRHEQPDGPFDEWHVWLLGVVAGARGLARESQALLLEALGLRPWLWPAWEALARSLESREALERLTLPSAPVFQALFLVEANVRVQRAELALAAAEGLGSRAVLRSDWVLGKLGRARHMLQDCEGARELFSVLRQRSPHRLQGMDDLANSLFVLAEKVGSARLELIALARQCARVDRFHPVTCSVLGNYHSLRNEHEKAVEWHQRAVRLDPANAQASYILIGHEFMELKNTPAAILSYRRALDLNPSDCRAWYALGNAYELLQMPSHSLHYYLKAHQTQPADSRFLVALGDVLCEKGAFRDARAAFWRAHSVGDPDGAALYKLAQTYELDPAAPTNGPALAAAAFWNFLKVAAESEERSEEMEARAYLFLANYALEKGKWDAALTYAQSALHYPLSKSRAKQLLQQASDHKRRSTLPPASASTPSRDIKTE